ncbi:hypothetical protein A3H16_03680 [Candidatus Kaiserbacteria bacterium RIFCSPLOWO2_12_FULL_53_8]|uniref:Uncharacterized protein n=2 Tax=Candidatus Kaiseribacteriota TaxID=1752734 RepID=A0A1F6CTE5_9BACT|nr:MAG: hypothetical protein A2851_05420 [Candidatus Kaiserbacteria bacterium RIFCSPHIGHO2_01_FULL_53_29]OGG92146.1 MAG: hypothetical protein A3H16_03680 [Candidatus Kaiserbacteria bacterium RIFCSPLOWO2_12_FULL_53_8]
MRVVNRHFRKWLSHKILKDKQSACLAYTVKIGSAGKKHRRQRSFKAQTVDNSVDMWIKDKLKMKRCPFGFFKVSF